MRKSTIHKHARAGVGSALATSIGEELRRRRLEAGFSQEALGDPLSRAFVCAVERGRAVPSIPALALFADRLGITLEEFFLGVHSQMTPAYNQAHERDTNPTPSGRR